MPSKKVKLTIATTVLASLVQGQSADPFANFDTNIKACTAIDRVLDVLPSKSQDAVFTFCNSFVGYSTTTVTGQTDVWVTSAIPLKTITVTAAPQPKHVRADGAHDPEQETHPSQTNTITPTITNPPLISASIPASLHNELKRAKLPTPAAFKNWASLAIRTGCACLGFSTQVTFPVFTTTTATSTVPASCVLAPLSAYHLSSYSPASASAVAYEYGPFIIFDPVPDPIEQCCRDCLGRGGCVQFVYEKLDPAVDIGYARCNYLYFDDYDGQSVTGIPRLSNEKFMSCPNGYLAVEGLTKEAVGTDVGTATFLGPCAVSTTVAR